MLILKLGVLGAIGIVNFTAIPTSLYPEEIFCTHLAKLDPSDIYLLALYIFIK